MTPTTVFLASSFQEFESLRRQVDERLLPFRLDFSLVDLNDATSYHRSPLERSVRAVDRCDVVVVLVGTRYGATVNDRGEADPNGRSIVHREVERALSGGKALLPFLIGSEWDARLARPDGSLLVQLAQLCRQTVAPIVAGDIEDPAVVSRLGDMIVSSLVAHRYRVEPEDVRVDNHEDFGRGALDQRLGFRLPASRELVVEDAGDGIPQVSAARFDADSAMTLLDAGLLEDATEYLGRAVELHPTHAPRALTLSAMHLVAGASATVATDAMSRLTSAMRFARIAERVEGVRAIAGTMRKQGDDSGRERTLRCSASAIIDAAASRLVVGFSPDAVAKGLWGNRAVTSADRAMRALDWYWPAKLEAARSYQVHADVVRAQPHGSGVDEAKRLEVEAHRFLLDVFWLRAETWGAIGADSTLGRLSTSVAADLRRDFRQLHLAMSPIEQSVVTAPPPMSASYYDGDVMRSVYSLRSRSRRLIQGLSALASQLTTLGAQRPVWLAGLSSAQSETEARDAQIRFLTDADASTRRRVGIARGGTVLSGVTVAALLAAGAAFAPIAMSTAVLGGCSWLWRGASARRRDRDEALKRALEEREQFAAFLLRAEGQERLFRERCRTFVELVEAFERTCLGRTQLLPVVPWRRARVGDLVRVDPARELPSGTLNPRLLPEPMREPGYPDGATSTGGLLLVRKTASGFSRQAVYFAAETT